MATGSKNDIVNEKKGQFVQNPFGRLSHLDGAQVRDESQRAIIDRHIEILKISLVLVLFLIGIRVLQGGLTGLHLFQFALSILMLALVLFRDHVPKSLMVPVFFGLVFLLCLSGVIAYGLLAPTFLLLLLMPTMIAVIWGWLPAAICFTIIMVLLVSASVRFWFFDIPSPADSTFYMASFSNWAIYLLVFGLCSIWSVIIVSIQRKFWVSANLELNAHGQFRSETEEKLRHADAWWSTLSENLPGMLFNFQRSMDGTSKIISVSDGCEKILGFSATEIMEDFNRVIARIDPVYWAEINEKISTSQHTMAPFEIRFSIRGRNDKTVWLQATGSPRSNKDGTVLWNCMALDITSQVDAEFETMEHQKRAEQTERQRNIGQLTGGIAHDFNNLLAVIMGSMELLETTELDDEQRRLVRNSLETSMRGADLTRDMLSFARQAQLRPTSLQLNDVFQRSESWIGRTVPANIPMTMSLQPNLWKVKADETASISAFLNLIVNARDSMPQGGKISITTQNVELGVDNRLEIEPALETGKYVKVIISDTGSGMGKETLRRVFEPYYSTKPPTAGTGLGLPMVQGFMQQSQGGIRIDSKEGRGTKITLYFKADEGESIAANQDQKEMVSPKATPARILLVEDEPAVLRILNTILVNAGYSIVAAESGDKAAEIFNDDSAFDLVVTDIVMTGILQGTTMAQHFRKTHPDLKFIFVTGYSYDDPQLSTGILEGDTRLEKPVKSATLIAEIERTLAL